MPSLECGYKLIDEFITHYQLKLLNDELETVSLSAKAGGIRNAEKKFPYIRELAHSNQLIDQAKKYLRGAPSLVRAILFNKTPDNNWLVTWHQDKTVAVSEKFENREWGPWSIKDGVNHVQPPVIVLNQMVTFRVHLDDTSEKNGCLKVLPKSQDLGLLDHAAIQRYALSHEPVLCEAKAGSALAMRPHILHSSSKATEPTQRRVLHLEYSSFKLPAGVAWA